MERLTRTTRASALVATTVLAFAGLLAGAVRVLPWLLDPAVPWRVAEPFARGLAAVAIEAALLVGWPIGWALACFRFTESGEARVLQTLGEPPHGTVARLVPHGVLFGVSLAAVALVYGHDASAPGRVATELVARARASCAAVSSPATYPVPFTDMTWLCAPDRAPRLVGPGPGSLAEIVLTAGDARIAGDFRAIDLDDARVVLPGPSPVAVHVGALSLHGLAPWARASTLPAPLRALVLALTGWSASLLAAYLVLRRAARTRLGALVLGAAGPIASLATMRVLERGGASAWVFVVVPLVGSAAAVAVAAAFSRLRLTGRAATTWVKV
jgi:hypothetical protein